ncbi:hypothetical protein MY11210_008626 [Beauveria gryllotalpidicola]
MAIPTSRRVAVIGAGASGVFTTAHLIAHGLDVEVFERNAAPGGIWLYSDRAAIPPSFPSMKPSMADMAGSDGQDVEDIALQRAPPGPCYQNLKTNVPTQLMAVTLLDVPLHTPEYVPHSEVLDYIQRIAAKYSVNNATTYGARVEEVEKLGAKWVVRWTMPPKRNGEGHIVEELHYSHFDAVVVATGHYHAPRIPDVPGLSSTRERYPSRVMHSKQYRCPEHFNEKVSLNFGTNCRKVVMLTYEGLLKTVLIIGGGVSSVDIAKDMTTARHIYQSTRGSSFDLDPRMLPKNASRVNEVVSFQLDDCDSTPLCDDEPLPVSAIMSSGDALRGIDIILLCTGYHISLPFLREYHNDDISLEDADDNILVTDGTQVHNLHKDIFYIPDPTLAFVGLPFYTFTHSVFDFQAITVAHVLSGVVDLPKAADMRGEYQEKVKAVGLGKTFHSLLNKEEPPCYDSLRNNIDTPLMQVTLNAWPKGTPRVVTHPVIKRYIKETSARAGVDAVTIYGALVSEVCKHGSQWHVRWNSLGEKGNTSNVLLIGGGVSSTDISKDISSSARAIYQSTRNGLSDMSASALPKNATRVSEVAAIGIESQSESTSDGLPFIIHLRSGSTISGIDKIIICTGYQFTLPFLPQFNDDQVEPAAAGDGVLITDGGQVHNLHQDIFYMPDPTLTFVGIPLFTTIFTLFEFQAMAVAAFYLGIVQLPPQAALRREYRDRVRSKGLGRYLHSLKEEEESYVRDLVDWVNEGRARHGLELLEGHTATWKLEKQLIREAILKLRAARDVERAAAAVNGAQLEHVQ